MRAAALVAMISFGALGGCGACGSKKRQRRSSDAGAAVEPIKVPVFGDGAPAGAADEVEPNDNDDVATPLPLGGTVHGRIDPETDADFYRIDVTAAGALAIEVSAVDHTDLTLEVHDATGNVIARSDRGAAKTKEGVPNLGVQPGRYLAVVRAKKIPVKGKPKKPPANAPPAPALPYDITANVAAITASTEHEPDDDRGTANDLIAGDPMTGFIGWTNDVDVWKLSVETLSAKNALDLEVGAVEGVALALDVADGVGQTLLSRKAPKGAPLVVRGLVPNVPAGAPPFHYLTVRATPSNPESPYSLKVTAKNPEPDAEAEPDDALDKPMAIPTDRTQVEGHWSPGDVDCYAIPPDPAARNVEVAIESPQEADLAIEMFVDGKPVAKSDTKGKGIGEKVIAAVPANGHVVVRIRGNDAGIEGTYSLKITEPPGAPPVP